MPTLVDIHLRLDAVSRNLSTQLPQPDVLDAIEKDLKALGAQGYDATFAWERLEILQEWSKEIAE